jgi:polyribonucleotide nucleotidyltransferase
VRKLVGGKRIEAVEDVLAVGQKVQVELKEIDPRGKLSLAAVLAEGEGGGDAEADEAPAEHSDAETDAPRADHDDRGERREGGRSRNRRRGGRGGDDRGGDDRGGDAPEGAAPATSEDAAG